MYQSYKRTIRNWCKWHELGDTRPCTRVVFRAVTGRWPSREYSDQKMIVTILRLTANISDKQADRISTMCAVYHGIRIMD